MAPLEPVTNAAALVMPPGSTLDPVSVFAVATRTNAAHAALGTQLLAVGPNTATVRVAWRDDLRAAGDTGRWANTVVALLIDHVCSLAGLMALDDAARWAGSLEVRVDYRRPLDATPFLVAHAVCDDRVDDVAHVRAVVGPDLDEPDPMAVGLCTIAVNQAGPGGARP